MRKPLALTIAAAALLAGCSSSEDEAPEDTRTAGEIAASASATSSAAADDVDITAELTASQPWAGLVTSAIRTEPDRVIVETTIVDPRGAAGSPAALQALEVCEAVAAWLQAQGVAVPLGRVLEADGSTFVVLNLPGSPPGCFEY